LNLDNKHKLDNPIWFALQETHKSKSIDFNSVAAYKPNFCSFIGSKNNKNIQEAYLKYSKLSPTFFSFGEKPVLDFPLKIDVELKCLQMILYNDINLSITEEIVTLNVNHQKEVFNLVNLVQPGYFNRDTFLLGKYYGIFKDNKLVAVTGERMLLNDFTEISAVVTHPDYVKKGYAKQLITHCVNVIFKEGKIPFLHVLETNETAVNVYLKLGFETRKYFSIWKITATKQ